jgi:hypothetical protein
MKPSRLGLLRPRGERPRHCGAAEQRDEIAPSHASSLARANTLAHRRMALSCASQQKWAADDRNGSMLLKKSRNAFWRLFRKKRS